MKTIRFILAAGLSMAAMLSLSSCQKEENNSNEPSGETKPLTLASSSVEVKAGETATVEITSGNGGYNVVSASEETATATVSGTTITVSGVKAGSTIITVSDAAKQAKPLQVKVTKSGKNTIPTDVCYTIEVFDTEQGYSYNSGGWNQWEPTLTKKVENTYIASILDINNKTANAEVFYSNGKIGDAVQEYISTLNPDEDVILLGGYIADGDKPDYGYSSPAIQVTANDDAEHPGCKVVTVLSTCISGTLGWEDGKYYSRPGTGWYDPTDGSITLKDCEGGLYWGSSLTWKIKLNRKYTPVK